MKEIFISSLEVGETITSFFMLKELNIRVGSNGKKYCDMTLADKSGEITAKKWDISEDDENLFGSFPEYAIVKVKGTITEWQTQKQMKVTLIREANDQDPIEMMDYVRCAPEDPEEMYEFILSKAESLGDEDFKKICVKLLTENKDRLLYYPAASKNHHAEMAGLLYHVKRMLMSGEKLCDVYTYLNKDLVMCGVIIHDIEKLNEIESNEYGISPGYSFEGQMLGHLVQGVKKIDQVCSELDVPSEKAIMLEHMMISHHYEPEYGSPRKPMFAEAELLHYLDIVDARMYDYEYALEAMEEGQVSDRIWTLDNRRIYKQTF